MQSLKLEGNTVGKEAAEAIGKALQKRQEFEVRSLSLTSSNNPQGKLTGGFCLNKDKFT